MNQFKECAKCKTLTSEKVSTEVGNPQTGGFNLCPLCAATALFNLIEEGIIRPENVKTALDLP